MSLLLPDDTADNVTQIASGISERMAQEKITTWINKHLHSGKYVLDLI